MPTAKSPYYDRIKGLAALNGCSGYDPRHIEAYMRIEHSTLDHLSASRFKTELFIAVECIDTDGLKNAESLAVSFGL